MHRYLRNLGKEQYTKKTIKNERDFRLYILNLEFFLFFWLLFVCFRLFSVTFGVVLFFGLALFPHQFVDATDVTETTQILKYSNFGGEPSDNGLA